MAGSRSHLSIGRLLAILVAAATMLLTAGIPASAASGPTLVKDINPKGDSNPSSTMTVVGNTLFFAANDGVHGVELWKSDGTAAGTKMVKNIRPKAKSSWPDYLVNLNGTLYFTATDGPHGRELWKSDGTAAGTKMVKDLHTGPPNQFGGNSTMIHERMLAIGNRLFFLTNSCCVGGQMLHVSNGTTAGTYYINMDEDFMSPDEFSVGKAGGKFFFVSGVWDGEEYSWRLFVSDGTQAGTQIVAGSPKAEHMGILPNNGTKLYFYADGILWRTDGTQGGTIPITSAGELPTMPTESVIMAKRLYFNDDALWKSDGTMAGTKSISNGALSWLTATGGRLYFVRDQQLWTSNGKAAGTHVVKNFAPLYPRELIGIGKNVFFAVQDWDETSWSLWRSNGTAKGTLKIATFDPYPAEMGLARANLGGKLLFGADQGSRGVELWRYTP